MIRHKGPCIYRCTTSCERILEAPYHVLIIFFASEQSGAVYTSYHYMVEGPFPVKSWFTRHKQLLQQQGHAVNGINGTTSPYPLTELRPPIHPSPYPSVPLSIPHYMVEGPFPVKSWFTRHKQLLQQQGHAVNGTNGTTSPYPLLTELRPPIH
jgi:hypothetical protein